MRADALICSHPRSGGRWLRYLTAHYLAAHFQLEWEVTPDRVFAVVPDHHEGSHRGYNSYRFRDRRGMPLVAVCHQPYDWQLHRAFPTIFLARNPYDVVVSAYHHTREKGTHDENISSFIDHPRLGLASWIDYMNAWAPKLLIHRDAVLLAYGELDADPGSALTKVLRFLDLVPSHPQVQAAVVNAARLRETRLIRTGQEGNFWDHLQPEEIFKIQGRIQKDLSDLSSNLLLSIGVEVDPFPRATP